MGRRTWFTVGLLVVVALLSAACGDDDSGSADSGDGGGSEGRTLAVPKDYDTIQAAVDASASPSA